MLSTMGPLAIVLLLSCAVRRDGTAVLADGRAPIAPQIAFTHEGAPAPTSGTLDGPDTAVVDLWRPVAGAEKIYVEADPGDGKTRLFLLDTGAAISVVSKDVAAELGLETEDPGHVLVGLGGQSAWHKATLPALHVGPFTVHDVDVAVDVPGVPDKAGLAPVAGILGNNVWGHFILGIDYPADVLELARPGCLDIPRHAEPVVFDGEHLTAGAVLVADRDGERLKQTVLLEVDTGARGLIIDGLFGTGLEAVATEGEEPIFGVGAGDSLPASNFMQHTRRIPIVAVDVGGRTVKRPLVATWINYERGRSQKVGPSDMPGLLGHQVLEGYRVVLDFPGQRMALTASERPPHQNDMHLRYLAELQADPEAALERADVLISLSRTDEARSELEAFLATHPDDAKAEVLEARLLRQAGELDRALGLLASMAPGTLVDEGEIIGTVNGLWLAGRLADGFRIAEAATRTHPEAPDVWVALSDARRASGDFLGAREAIGEANRLEENPDGHLLRRAWISTQEGDRYGAITFMRELMHLYPAGGVAPWFYAMEVAGTPEEGMFRNDLGRALGRLHPTDRPFDFLAAAYAELGESAEARNLMTLGRDKDCPLAGNDVSEKNCEAWYLALSQQDLVQARTYIDGAIAADPNRPEFLDTLAVVLLAQGEVEGARDAAWRAASMSPDDVYLLWQAARMDVEAKAQDSVLPEPQARSTP
jgi:tetratricopeptide (TPR) repeat protein